MSDRDTPLASLNARSLEIFRQVVEAYVETGEPVGSRTLSRRLGLSLSPATIRNVMSDLEEAGLLYAPYVSAGRMPTEEGMRLFVNGLLEIGSLNEDDKIRLDERTQATGKSLEQALDETVTLLSGLSRCAGLVLAPKTQNTLKHIEFVALGPGRALVVMVMTDGVVENRVMDIPIGLPPSALVEAGNYLNARLLGRTLEEIQSQILAELEAHRTQLDEVSGRVVAAGLATWSGDDRSGSLIVRGQSHLLEDVTALADLEHIRALFEALEAKQQILRLLELTGNAEGVQIFIGSETKLFGLSGCSMIVAPYRNSQEKIVGAIGVIGPTRINYAHIIPLVDYTSRVVGRLIG